MGYSLQYQTAFTEENTGDRLPEVYGELTRELTGSLIDKVIHGYRGSSDAPACDAYIYATDKGTMVIIKNIGQGKEIWNKTVVSIHSQDPDHELEEVIKGLKQKYTAKVPEPAAETQ